MWQDGVLPSPPYLFLPESGNRRTLTGFGPYYLVNLDEMRIIGLKHGNSII